MAEQVTNPVASETAQQEYNGCQWMLQNSLQCANSVYALINKVPYCRLHTAVLINSSANRDDITVCNPDNDSDLEMMLKTTPTIDTDMDAHMDAQERLANTPE